MRLSILIVCLVAVAAAQLLPYPQLGDLRGLDDTVETTQIFYNRNFDEAIRLSGRASDAAARLIALGNVQSVFCSDGSFQGWTAYSPNATTGAVEAIVVPSLEGVAGLYQYLAGIVFVNFSTHIVTNFDVDVYRIRNIVYANLTASITQTAVTATPNGYRMVTNHGRYYNTYKLVGLRFCMQKFEASTFIQYELPGVPTGPVNFDTGRY